MMEDIPRSERDREHSFLLYRCGGGVQAVPSPQVTRIVRVPRIDDPSSSTMVYEGREIPLVDLAALQGLSSAAKCKHVLIVRSSQQEVGFLVDAAESLIQLPGKRAAGAPRILNSLGYLSEIVRLDGETVMVVDLASLAQTVAG